MKDSHRIFVNRRDLIRNGLLIASGCACAPLAFGEDSLPQTAPSGATQTWTIGNELIERILVYNPKAGLYTHQFNSLSTRIDFAVQANPSMGREFSFLCNGRDCSGDGRVSGFALIDAKESTLPNGRSLTIRMKHDALSLEVSVVYSAYDSHQAIRKHLVLRNTGASALAISHMTIEAIYIALGPANELTLLTQYGTIPRETFYTGRTEDAGLLIANGVTGQGIAVVSEVPGCMKRTEIGGWDADAVGINVMYDTDLMPFERSLAPGETFTTAAVSLLPFLNGDGFNDPHWVLPAYTAQVLERRVDAQGPPWIYNTWEPFYRGVNRKTVLELVDVAGEMGMDIFTIDDGWQQDYGENAVNFASFPGGLQSIIEAVEAKGMRLGLWIPLAAVGTSTAVYRQHPEWAALDQDGNAKITGTAAGAMGVMCMATAYREAAAARVIDAIEKFHLAYVKLDLTTIFNAYGEAPGCWAKGHLHGSWAESLNMIYEGISWVTAKVYAAHPDVLLDLTFELWGQKHIIDAGLLAAGDLDWMSNVDDNQLGSAGPLQARQLLYQRAASMPVESMLIGNIHAELPSIQESFATAIGSAPLLLGDLRKLSAADREWYHEKISWFKKLRRSTKISESFFPLGSWLQTTSTAWDGFARLARSGNGVIALFRNYSNAEEALVKLPLMPAGKYSLRSVITGKDIGNFAASDFARGVAIDLKTPGPAEVIEVTRLDQTKRA